MLVGVLRAPRLPLHAAIHRLERRGLVRSVGVTTTLPQDAARG